MAADGATALPLAVDSDVAPERRPSRSGGRRSGLVPSTTSGTPAEHPANALLHEIDRCHVRAQRMRKSILTGARLLVEEGQKGGFRGRWAMIAGRIGKQPA